MKCYLQLRERFTKKVKTEVNITDATDEQQEAVRHSFEVMIDNSEIPLYIEYEEIP